MARKAALSEARLTASICRESFEDFVRNWWSEVPGAGNLIWNWHLSVLCAELQDVAERIFAGNPRKHNCVFNISPGTSKSTICSILFPAWTWTRMPSCRVLTASHTDLLVLDFANKSRTVIKSEKYRACFPEIDIREDQDTKGYYQNTAGGDRITCTVAGKSPTGMHAHLLIIDDPIDPKKAASDVELKIAENFMTEVLPGRQVDKRVSVTFLVMQRLHPRDPTEVMLEKARAGASPVRHVRLPAISEFPIHPPDLKKHYDENDGLMDPIRLSKDAVKEQRVLLGEYGFCAQFGQEPRLREGGMFAEASFGPSQRKRIAPFEAKRIRYWDRAATTDGGCYTAGVLIAMDSQGYVYVEHCVHGQWSTKKRNEVMRSTAQRDRNRYGPNYEPIVYVEHEGGSSGKDAWLETARFLQGFHVRKDHPTGSKETRAEPWSSYIEAGTVFFVDDGSWDLKNFIEEHCLFPQGRYRDQVDAACLVAGTFVETVDGRVPIEEVVAGTRVWTREGLREVLWSGQTGEVFDLVTVTFSDGSSLTGTPSHPVWTQGRGFVRMDTLSVADDVLSFEDFSWRSEGTERGNTTTKRWNSEESRTAEGSLTVGITRLLAGTRNGNSMRLIPCIGLSGGRFTVISLMDMTSITKMGIRSTTRRRTLSACPKNNIGRSIVRLTGLQSNWPIWDEYNLLRRSGIGRRREGNGIVSMESERGWVESLPNVSVRGVKAISCRGDLLPSSAPRSAMGKRDTHERIEKLRVVCVRNAERNSWQSLEGVYSAQSPARCGGGGTVPVYNLEVQGCPEFFANGILVHNSAGFNLITGRKRAGTLHTYPIKRREKKSTLQIIICTLKELSSLPLEGKGVLVLLTDPLSKASGVPQDVIGHLQATLTLSFTNLDPRGLQESWDKPVPVYNQPLEKLIMGREHGTRLWSFLLRDHGAPLTTIVLVDEGDGRALSVAQGVCDALRLPRKEVVSFLAREDNEEVGGEPPNKHIYQVAKSSKALVRGG